MIIWWLARSSSEDFPIRSRRRSRLDRSRRWDRPQHIRFGTAVPGDFHPDLDAAFTASNGARFNLAPRPAGRLLSGPTAAARTRPRLQAPVALGHLSY
jgi:hypothetical protein